MAMITEREKVESIIKQISSININNNFNRDRDIQNINKLIDLKQNLKRIKPSSRLASNPSIGKLSILKNKLIIQKQFHDKGWEDPNKLLMAVAPAFIFICLIAPPGALILLTLLLVN